MKIFKDYNKLCYTSNIISNAYKKCEMLCVDYRETLKDVIYKCVNDNLVDEAYIRRSYGTKAKDVMDSEIYVADGGKEITIGVNCCTLEEELLKYSGNDCYSVRFQIRLRNTDGVYETSVYARLQYRNLEGEVGRVRIEEKITETNIESNRMIKEALDIAKNSVSYDINFDKEIECDIKDIAILVKARMRPRPETDTEMTGL